MSFLQYDLNFYGRKAEGKVRDADQGQNDGVRQEEESKAAGPEWMVILMQKSLKIQGL